ncbi:hypothetical protein ABH944_004215 [Caballeronia udeis]|uniref:Uncharacterized protein n=1 Tax=Caballeronia udeis TaxID=1232866 RepID=A0ABW8ML66_9BURK
MITEARLRGRAPAADVSQKSFPAAHIRPAEAEAR